MTALATLKALGVIGAVLLIFWLVQKLRKGARDAYARKQSDKINDIKDAQARARMDAPRSRDELVNRLRERGL